MANNPITPGYFLQAGRYNNGLDPSGYDPNNTVDPMQAIAVQQQYAKSILQYQQQLTNPRLALPQQFGAALGGAVQGWLPNSMQEQPPAGGQQPQQGPQTDQGQALHQAAVQLMQQNPGMAMPEALYKAADQTDASGTYDADPMMEKVLDHARDWAKKQGYNPSLDSEEKTKAQYKPAEQFKNKKTGEVVLSQPGTDLYKHVVDSGDFVKLGDTPQLTPGSVHEIKKGGLFQTSQVDAQGNLDTTKPVAKSTAPIQLGATLSGDDAKNSGLYPGRIVDNVDYAKTRDKLSNRSIATQNFSDAVDQLTKTATAESIGNPGDFNEKALNIGSTVGTLAKQFGLSVSTDPDDYKSKYSSGLAKSIAKNGVDAERVKSLMLSTALLHEAMSGDKNSPDANRKYAVEQHMRILGEDSSNLPALLATLQQDKDMAMRQLKNEFEGNPNIGVSKPKALQEWEKQQSENSSISPSASPMSNWNADKKARYEAWKKAHHPNG